MLYRIGTSTRKVSISTSRGSMPSTMRWSSERRTQAIWSLKNEWGRWKTWVTEHTGNLFCRIFVLHEIAVILCLCLYSLMIGWFTHEIGTSCGAAKIGVNKNNEKGRSSSEFSKLANAHLLWRNSTRTRVAVETVQKHMRMEMTESKDGFRKRRLLRSQLTIDPNFISKLTKS